MAVYKLFPYKDTTLYSMYPSMNTGIDPILQISNLNFAMNTSPQVARALVKFVDSEINDTLNNLVGTSSWKAYFKLFIATAQGIVEDSTLEIWPAAVSATPSIGWNNGTGTYLDQPLTTDGACWESPFFAAGDPWPIILLHMLLVLGILLIRFLGVVPGILVQMELILCCLPNHLMLELKKI
jgi:hypothetical protein